MHNENDVILDAVPTPSLNTEETSVKERSRTPSHAQDLPVVSLYAFNSFENTLFVEVLQK